MLPTLRALTAAHAELPELAEKLAYLEEREAQMQYPRPGPRLAHW